MSLSRLEAKAAMGCGGMIAKTFMWSMTWGWRIFSPLWLLVCLVNGSTVWAVFWGVASIISWGPWLTGWVRRRRYQRAEIAWLATFDEAVIPVIAGWDETWPAIMYHLGLTGQDTRRAGLTQSQVMENALMGRDLARPHHDLAEAMAGDDATRITPQFARLQPITGGFSVEADLIPGQRERDWIDRADAFASAWALHTVTVDPLRPGTVLIRAYARDMLADTRDVSGIDRHRGAPQILGRTEDGGDLTLDLVRDGGHTVLQGMTGSGKSSTSYVLLSQLAGRDDCEVWGVDPSGVLLSPWERHRGHRVLGTRDLDAVVTVTGQAVDEMEQRLEHLLTLGRDSLTVNRDCPAIVFVIEEFPGLMGALATADRALKPAERREPIVRANVARLLMEGRKVGIRVVIMAQRADASIIGGAERSNVAWRITHRVDKSEAVAMLHEAADRQTVERIARFNPGDAWIEGPGLAPCRIRADFLAYEPYAEQVRAMAPPTFDQTLRALRAEG